MEYIKVENAIYKLSPRNDDSIFPGKIFMEGKYAYEYDENPVNPIIVDRMLLGEVLIGPIERLSDLIDEYVIEYEGKTPFTTDFYWVDEQGHFDLAAMCREYAGAKSIKGAIYTPIGLIYVTKILEPTLFEGYTQQLLEV